MQKGTIRGQLRNADGLTEPPSINICVGGEVIGNAETTQNDDGFAVTAPIPAEALADGVTTIVFRLSTDQSVLGSYPIRAGSALDGDVVTDIAVLKTEVDALKAAFLAEAHSPKLRAVERDLIIAEAVEAALAAGAAADPETGEP